MADIAQLVPAVELLLLIAMAESGKYNLII